MFYWSQNLSTEYRDNNTRIRDRIRWKYRIEWFLMWQLFLAIIVTGSYKSNKRSVEVLRDDGSSLCYLPDLPYDYEGHTQSGLVTCGGTDSAYTRIFCYTFSSGAWTQSHSLLNSRWYHSAWSSPLGTVVMGGEYSTSATTTELLTDDGQSRELFSLKYSTK